MVWCLGAGAYCTYIVSEYSTYMVTNLRSFRKRGSAVKCMSGSLFPSGVPVESSCRDCKNLIKPVLQLIGL
jgi:hypothetical protein